MPKIPAYVFTSVIILIVAFISVMLEDTYVWLTPSLLAVGLLSFTQPVFFNTLMKPSNSKKKNTIQNLIRICIFGFIIYGFSLIFSLASQYKISLNSMPITWSDVRFGLFNLGLLAKLIGFSQYYGWFLGLVATLLFLAFLSSLAANLRSPASSLALVFCISIATITFRTYTEKIYHDTKAKVSREADSTELWTLDGVAKLANEIGAFPFLVYSYELEKQTVTPFLNGKTLGASLSLRSLEETAAKYFELTGKSLQQPNIVLVQLESIFNPNWAFRIEPQFDSKLFQRDEFTKVLAPMRVNIIGGGSWVSEFEALTGLDTRLFGYKGYYTHATLGPAIDKAISAEFKQRGYQTSVFYTASGAFQNARVAYQKYGFDEFFEPKDLGFKQEWLTLPDTEIAKAFVDKTKDLNPSKPFFAYIVTNGAHSPYFCTHFKEQEKVEFHFQGENDWGMNCELNEYIYLVRQSEQAVELIKEYLVNLEKSTGRPFVLLIYGDHQPHSFTSTWKWVQREYSGVRTPPKNKRETFLHLRSSQKSINFKGLDNGVPITIVPALLQAFFSGENISHLSSFYLFDRCGIDSFPNSKSPIMFGLEKVEGRADMSGEAELTAISPSCKEAQDLAISTQKSSGIISSEKID
jgi:phosphoglycerol transferase MdoB-like AlkP superfamily enzyme